MRQERAVHTRHRLVRAAAGEFARNGGAGTSLGRVCAAAEATMGALTFHFPTKQQLTDAVRKQGLDTTRAAARAAVRPGPRLQSVIDITHTAALLLQDNVVVRAANRLCQEGPDGRQEWYAAWLGIVRTLAEQAAKGGELNARTQPRQVVLLAACFVAGIETSAAAVAIGRGSTESSRRQLVQLWQTAIPSVAAAELCQALSPDSSVHGAGGGRCAADGHTPVT
ncbi:TetR family transcriptional regulator [Streptomyces cavernicola]|uniref:TetR family transcriptional regulator n=1 Tax=Streptomyces cavernicola TaxID=3043613 RepID=A0ABT6S598_9ACTN|nr:TetR family transcriptional regulator [Streptomyces sp. B-S-A6]MDI3403259.1 TetR family transcriptional regulator [Streptomyces sp. B-S-A6]